MPQRNRPAERCRRAVREGDIDGLRHQLNLRLHLICATDDKGHTLLHLAVQTNQRSVILELLTIAPTLIDVPTKHGATPLHYAVLLNNEFIVELLLQMGSRAIDVPDLGGETPLYKAVYNKCLPIIKTLIRFNSQAIDVPNGLEISPLLRAIFGGNFTIIKTLLYFGALPTSDHEKRRVRDLYYDEDEAAKVRYEVYFAWPLVQRCLIEI